MREGMQAEYHLNPASIEFAEDLPAALRAIFKNRNLYGRIQIDVCYADTTFV